ncbi:hypothetical protein RUND412_005668 [Rhizina undulata]
MRCVGGMAEENLCLCSYEMGSSQYKSGLDFTLSPDLEAIWCLVVQSISFLLKYYGKKKILGDIKSGKTMVVLATEALGMGCDINDVEVVLILGVKNLTFASLKQREGRAGRNPGLQSNSILIAEPWTINYSPPDLPTATSIPSL